MIRAAIRRARAPRWPGAGRFLAFALALGAPAGAHAAPQATGEGSEGLLSNDAFLPTSREIATLIARGDAALAPLGDPAALSLEADDARRAASVALERWFEALRDAPPGTTVPVDPAGLIAEERARWPDPDASAARRTEAVERAVLRRLALSAPALAELWGARVSAEADAALADARGSPAALARVESRFPATRGAALAALKSAELALEGGRPEVCESWLARAADHAALAGAEDVRAALAGRRAAALAVQARRSAPAPSSPAAAPSWAAAQALELLDVVPLLPAGLHVLGRRPPQAGLARLDDGRVAAQVEGVVWLVDPRGRQQAFEPARLIAGLGLTSPLTLGGRDSGWVQRPATDGTWLFLVEGRAGARFEPRNDPFPGRRREVWQSNMLLAVEPPRNEELPVLRWSLGPEEWVAPDGARTPLAEVLAPGMWEFQPGPEVAGSLLLVQARRFPLSAGDEPAPEAPNEARCHLLALDRLSGAVVWQHFLGRGTDLAPELEQRFSRRELVATPSLPVVRSGALAFAPTSLGMGFVVELADGRLVTSLLNRRRNAERDGWTGLGRPPLVEREIPVALWAPPDSDFLYTLRLDAAPGATRVFELSPLPIGEAQELVGGDLERVYVVGRAGARHTFSAWEPATGRRFDSIYFGRAERPLPGALVRDGRAVVATDRGLYLFDLERELYLLQHLADEIDPSQPAASLFDDGELLLLLAERGLYRFRAQSAQRTGR